MATKEFCDFCGKEILDTDEHVNIKLRTIPDTRFTSLGRWNTGVFHRACVKAFPEKILENIGV